MKYADPSLLLKAFIRVAVNQSTHKVYFKDVKMCKKLKRRPHLSVPCYEAKDTEKCESEHTDN